MGRRDLLARAGLVVLCAVFVGGLAQLNRVSLNRSYPSLSSLRSDGGGTALLWEGLARTGKVSQQRNYRPLEETHFTGSSVFYLGLRPSDLTYADETFFRTAERIAHDGNRLVLGFTDDPIDSDEKNKKDSLARKRWNIRFVQSKTKGNGSATVSVEAQSPWQPLTNEGPGLIFERKFGAGSIVLLPHVSRISNVMLAKDENSRQLIPMLIGNNGTVIFDEAHFGIVESGSIAGLARRYRLQGLLAGLLMLTALFLWNRSLAFPPIQETEETGKAGLMAGNDTRSTLVSLLSRHIPAEDLLKICIAEWNRVRPDQRITEDGGTVGKDPVAMYRSIQENLTHEKTLKV
jgi:hypothetical protein